MIGHYFATNRFWRTVAGIVVAIVIANAILQILGW